MPEINSHRYLPVLSGIPPAELRRKPVILQLTRWSLDPSHTFFNNINRPTTSKRLKLSNSFLIQVQDLLAHNINTETWMHNISKEKWTKKMSRFYSLVTNENPFKLVTSATDLLGFR